MNDVNVPEGYVAIYFHIGRDDYDGELTLVQVDEDGDQTLTEVNWKEGTKTRKGVLFFPKDADIDEPLQIRLDVKPEQAQLVTHAPDVVRGSNCTPACPPDCCAAHSTTAAPKYDALVLRDDGFGRIKVEEHRIVPAEKPNSPFGSAFDQALTEAIKKDIWDR